MDLFYSSDLVENTTKARKRTKVQDNGGTPEVTHKATVTRYKQDVCFKKDAITSIIYLKKWIKKDRITYDSTNQIFVVHREYQ